MSPDLARAARQVEELPATDASFNCLCGAVVRIFTRLNEIEELNRRLLRRLRALEDPDPDRVASD